MQRRFEEQHAAACSVIGCTVASGGCSQYTSHLVGVFTQECNALYGSCKSHGAADVCSVNSGNAAQHQNERTGRTWHQNFKVVLLLLLLSLAVTCLIA
jgi:hypothetical protein